MKYLFSVIDDESTAAATADPVAAGRADEHRDVDAFNQRLEAAGHWVFAGGLASPSTATVIDNRNGEAAFTDGPFLESKEFIAGFWIINAPNLDVALKLAAEGSRACNRKVEVRPSASEPA